MAETSRARPPSVLIVDDDDTGRYAAERVLKADGFTVSCAGDGAAALSQLRVHDVDLMLCDIRMPGSIGGIALARSARIAKPGLKVLLITAYEGPDAGDVKVLQRPISSTALIAEIRAAIAGPRG